MYSGEADRHHAQKSCLQIKQDDKFFCRLLSKESSISIPSFRVTPVAIPFVWESQPGTPKHTFSDHSLPPLTPPPSYFYTHNASTKPSSKNKKKKASRSSLVHFLFPKLNLKKTLLLPPPSSSSSPSSLSYSSSSLSSDSSRANNVVPNGRRRRFLSYDSSVELWRNYEEDDGDAADSRNSPLCFGSIRRTASSRRGFGSCCRRQA